MELREKALIGSIAAGLAIAFVSVVACFVINATLQQRANAAGVIAGAHVGDKVAFGEYGGSTLNWIVVEENQDKVLLMSTKVIVAMQYNETGGSINTKDKAYHANEWVRCSLRAWLNNDFYRSAFNTEEQSIICKTAAESAEESSSKGVGYTADFVFIPSEDELENASAAIGDVKSTLISYSSGIWLRGSSGTNGLYANWIGPGNSKARVRDFENILEKCGIVPMLWVSRGNSLATLNPKLTDNITPEEKVASSNNSNSQLQAKATNTCKSCGKKGYRYSNPTGIGGNASAGTSAYVRDDANYKSIAAHGYCISCYSSKGK